MKTFISLSMIIILNTVIISTAQTCETPIDLEPYISQDTRPFVTLVDNQFMMDETPYTIHGINYYPSKYPWRRFLTEADLETIQTEFEMVQSIGINTLRIFLWNQALFQCNGTSSQPVEETFSRLDSIIQLASEYDLRLIVTLNDLPNLKTLYDNPQSVQEQTQLIVSRYKDEPTILAWDLRNEGDIDYGSRGILETRFPRVQVLGWLADTSQLVRSIDDNHLITAGWLNEAHSTAPSVDFISFHHWSSVDELQSRIRGIQLASNKPILLQEVGYSTHHVNITPQVQADLLEEMIQLTEEENLLGWMIWTAFDFTITDSCYPSPCQSPDNAEHDFGIWQTDYTPKPAVEVIERYASN